MVCLRALHLLIDSFNRNSYSTQISKQLEFYRVVYSHVAGGHAEQDGTRDGAEADISTAKDRKGTVTFEELLRA